MSFESQILPDRHDGLELVCGGCLLLQWGLEEGCLLGLRFGTDLHGDLLMCPNCKGQLVAKSHESVETHGLDCGPYERVHQCWWECSVCGERFDEEELQAMKEEERNWPRYIEINFPSSSHGKPGST